MLLLAKLAAVAVLIWFYLTAKEKGEPPINWAVTGVIGYIIVWWIADLTVVTAAAKMIPKTPAMLFLVKQIPAIAGIGVAFLIRKKLLADAAKKN